jgi:hypothetical protein
MSATKDSNVASLGDIEDLVHNFLIIMLEHSMRQKDGWKVGVFQYLFLYFLYYTYTKRIWCFLVEMV